MTTSLPPRRHRLRLLRRLPLHTPVAGPDTTAVIACPWALLDLARFCQEYHARIGGAAPCPAGVARCEPHRRPRAWRRSSCVRGLSFSCRTFFGRAGPARREQSVRSMRRPEEKNGMYRFARPRYRKSLRKSTKGCDGLRLVFSRLKCRRTPGKLRIFARFAPGFLILWSQVRILPRVLYNGSCVRTTGINQSGGIGVHQPN